MKLSCRNAFQQSRCPPGRVLPCSGHLLLHAPSRPARAARLCCQAAKIKPKKGAGSKKGFGAEKQQKQEPTEPWEQEVLAPYKVYYKPNFKPPRYTGPIEPKRFEGRSIMHHQTSCCLRSHDCSCINLHLQHSLTGLAQLQGQPCRSSAAAQRQAATRVTLCFVLKAPCLFLDGSGDSATGRSAFNSQHLTGFLQAHPLLLAPDFQACPPQLLQPQMAASAW